MVKAWAWAMVAGMGFLAGCSTTKDDGKKEKPKAKAMLVGRVASVPTGRGFVLIQSYGAWAVPAGATVFSCGDCEPGQGNREEGRLANLLPSGEKMAQFVAADVRSGQVAVGDAVYYRPEVKSGKPPADGTESEGQEQEPPENRKTDESQPKPPPKQGGERSPERGQTAENAGNATESKTER
jgi:hypothetical protein